MADGKAKDLVRITQSDKVLRDKVFKIANDPKYDGYKGGLASMVHKFFDKKSSESGVDISLANKSATELNYQLANELHRQIITKSKRRKFYSSFRDNIWDVDLADFATIEQIQQRNQKYLLCAIDLFSKYARVVSSKDKIRITIVNAFQKINYGLIKVVNFTIIFLRGF